MFDDIFSTLAHWLDDSTAEHTENIGSVQQDFATGGEPGALSDAHPVHGLWAVHVSAEGALQKVDIGWHLGLDLYPTTGHIQSNQLGMVHQSGEDIPPDLHLAGVVGHTPDFSPAVPWQHPVVPYENHWDPADFHGVGHPLFYSHFWQHQTGEDCAVMSQGEVLESITGMRLTEHQLCDLAASRGWYDPQTGTPPQDVCKILELCGIPVQHVERATFASLTDALQHEQRVIVGLNANEIWHPYRDSVTGEAVKLSDAGHAVWVTGIDQTPDGLKVILVDSGPGNGQVEAVDVHDFLNAWEDHGNFMIVTGPFSAGQAMN
jgi:hypothetical protein